MSSVSNEPVKSTPMLAILGFFSDPANPWEVIDGFSNF
jgi:hypothetical protein